MIAAWVDGLSVIAILICPGREIEILKFFPSERFGFQVTTQIVSWIISR